MGDPDQMFSLGELELSPILSTSVNTNAPSSTIAGYLWLYVFLIQCCYLPVLKPNLIYGPSSSSCDFCHRISFFLHVRSVLVVVVPHLTHCGHILLRDCKIVQVSVPSACSPNMSLVSAAGVSTETRATCEQYTWGQSPTSIETKTHKNTNQQIVLNYFVLFNIKESANIDTADLGKGLFS